MPEAEQVEHLWVWEERTLCANERLAGFGKLPGARAVIR